MRVVVTGGTGFIGRAVVEAFLAAGDSVAVLTRAGRPALPPGAQALAWQAVPEAGATWIGAVSDADAVVHLAGEPIASGRWSEARRRRILESRVNGTRAVAEAIGRAPGRPPALVSASAVGYYGPRGEEEITEAAAAGDDFLSRVCVAWEAEAGRAAEAGARVTLLRTGLVLARDGGALPRLVAPFRLLAGGPLGSGRQWVPWVHRDDLVALIVHLTRDEAASGPVNGVAPHPVRNREFARTIGRVLGRPAWLPAPAALLRLAVGEMADGLLLAGQRAVPARALALGFRFRYTDPDEALRAALTRP